MGYSLLIGAVAILVLPLVAVIALPVKAARSFLGLVLFGIGILFLDFATANFMPYDDDSPGDAFAALLMAAIIGIGALSTLLLAVRDRGLFIVEQEEGVRRLDWARALPVGALAGVVFMHWLRNRLAGAEPAGHIHGAVIAAFLAVFLIAGWFLWRRSSWSALFDRALLAFALAGIFLSIANIAMGFRMWERSREFAAGRPFCVMTYGGFETRRQARSGWDLSPLIDRHYGVWAVSKAPVVFLEDGGNIRSYRYFTGDWRDVSRSEREARHTPICTLR
jgi:hypothetical protein